MSRDSRDEFYKKLVYMYESETLEQLKERDLIDISLQLVRISRYKEDFVSEIPEEIWHYISDVDIRAKDRVYREKQLSSLHNIMQSYKLMLSGS